MNHSVMSKLGAKNVRRTNSASLGHTGKALKAESTIDMPGQFANWDGTLVLKATLSNCSCSKEHNFNLCILTRLLRNGWHIDKGDTNGITIKTRDGGGNCF